MHSDLEALPCARAPPFHSATHHQVHRHNCTNTNRCSFGRARVFPSAVMVYTYRQVISSGVGVRWEAFLTLSSRLHSLSLHRCQGHFKLESIVASSDAAEKHCACTRGKSGKHGGTGEQVAPRWVRDRFAACAGDGFIETGEASSVLASAILKAAPHP